MRVCPRCSAVSPDRAERCVACGGSLPERREPLVDGRYRLVKELGQGGMGVVYRAFDVALKREVALKFLTPEHARSSSAVAGFQREAAMLASIRDEHVAQVYAFGLSGRSFFFAMEFVQGANLAEIIDEHHKNEAQIPVHRALVVLRDLASGLTAVHAAGLVHRDVKPDNAVIEQGSGRPVLVDFGLAIDTEAQDAVLSGSLGTPAYMAPEQVESPSSVTLRADIYGLGCTAFELLTHRLPFEGESVAQIFSLHRDAPRPRLSELRPELAPLDGVIRKALARDPADRYASVAAFVADLEVAGQRWLRAPATVPPKAPSVYPAPIEDDEGGIRVLVVDDDSDFAALAEKAAKIAFFGLAVRVERVATGEEALAAATAHLPPQLVLLDYLMPGLDGVETLSRLRELPGARHARVLVVSAAAGLKEQWRFSALGVDGFLRKPITLRDLADAVTAIGLARGWVAD